MSNIQKTESSIKLSRSDIETLCVLHAVGKAGCRAGDLATRLGLSASLASAVADGMGGVIHSGLLDRSDDRYVRLAA